MIVQSQFSRGPFEPVLWNFRIFCPSNRNTAWCDRSSSSSSFHCFMAPNPLTHTHKDTTFGASSQQSGSLSVGRLLNCVWRRHGGKITPCGWWQQMKLQPRLLLFYWIYSVLSKKYCNFVYLTRNRMSVCEWVREENTALFSVNSVLTSRSSTCNFGDT